LLQKYSIDKRGQEWGVSGRYLRIDITSPSLRKTITTFLIKQIVAQWLRIPIIKEGKQRFLILIRMNSSRRLKRLPYCPIDKRCSLSTDELLSEPPPFRTMRFVDIWTFLA